MTDEQILSYSDNFTLIVNGPDDDLQYLAEDGDYWTREAFDARVYTVGKLNEAVAMLENLK